MQFGEVKQLFCSTEENTNIHIKISGHLALHLFVEQHEYNRLYGAPLFDTPCEREVVG